jgi:hypothetical protein
MISVSATVLGNFRKIRVSATWKDQVLSYLELSGSQLPGMIRVSPTWNVKVLSYLKLSGSQLS